MSTTICTKQIKVFLFFWLSYFAAYADFATINSCKIYYEIAGKGEAVVLIHGLSLDTRSWDGQWNKLQKHFKVIRYDIRGFGQSDRAHDPHNPTEDLKNLLEYLKIDKAHLVGLSLGANIALNFASKYPEKVKKIVVADANIDGFENYTPYLTTLFNTLIAEASQHGWTDDIQRKWFQSALMKLYVAPDETIIKLSEIIADYNGDHFISPKINPTFGIPATLSLLTQIKHPVLIIIGQNDEESMHRISQILQEKLPHAQKFTIPHAGHLSNMETPSQFNKLVLNFLR